MKTTLNLNDQILKRAKTRAARGIRHRSAIPESEGVKTLDTMTLPRPSGFVRPGEIIGEIEAGIRSGEELLPESER